MALIEKPDGRKYSQVLRRCVTIVEYIDENRKFSFHDIAVEINKNKTFTEFFISRTEEQMSVSRIQDYLRYLAILKVLEKNQDENNRYKLNFNKPSSDEDWVQIFSDLALEQLCLMLGKNPQELVEILKRSINELLEEKQIPTIDAILRRLNIDSGRTEEIFRWSLYIFLDSPICQFNLRRNPFLTIKE
jgi:hypothetical protein